MLELKKIKLWKKELKLLLLLSHVEAAINKIAQSCFEIFLNDKVE